MSFSILSVRRPIFFAAIVILMLVGGVLSLSKLPVDLMPKVDIPYVVVVVQYPGAGPKEVEGVITLPLEEELISLEGLKSISSTSQDSLAQVVLEFNLGLNPDTIEQKVRDRISLARARFPKAVLEPYIQKFDPASSSILTLSVRSKNMNRVALTDWIERELKPQLAQVPKVGKLDILGGLKREIHVVLDPKKLEKYRMPLVSVSDELGRSGENSPGGLIRKGGFDVGVRNVGEYNSIPSIENRVVSFSGGEYPIRVRDVGHVIEASERETTRAFHKGDPALIVEVFRQSGANVIQITDSLKKKVAQISEQLKKDKKDLQIEVVVDGAKEIRDNVWDVQESIIIGCLLTVLVVYLFLASVRSTLITGLALPNSLIGAFILMYLMGFSINVMTLLALSLAVGLLVDDAIVVRENIFKHLEAGKLPVQAALDGVKEVTLAVIATTIAIMAVFGPVAFIPGIIGQFFKEFGLTVCFAMLISLFDALTVAPMLSAYWGGAKHGTTESKSRLSVLGTPFIAVTNGFGRLQTGLENLYRRILEFILRFPKTSSLVGIGFAAVLFLIVPLLPTTFMPESETTTITMSMTLPTGTPLDAGEAAGRKLKAIADANDGVLDSILTIGNVTQESNIVTVKVTFKPADERTQKASAITEMFRSEVEKLKATLPKGTETQIVKGSPEQGGFPISLTVFAHTSDASIAYSRKLLAAMQASPLFLDAHSTEKAGRPEITVKVDSAKSGRFGVSESLVGNEVRGRIEGVLAGRYRDQGREYDLRVRMKDGAESFMSQIQQVLVPNLNLTPVRLVDVARVTEGTSIAKLERRNRSSSVTLNSSLGKNVGVGAATAEIKRLMDQELVPPAGVRVEFQGEAENFAEMGIGFAVALGFGLVLLYLVLASLYESFFVPVLVMTALPLAAGGAFVALFLAGQGIDMYSLIGILLLMGVATKNSILMVDTVVEHLREASDITRQIYIETVLESCVRRLRPIIMTSMALVAGMIPIAVGLNEASAQRTSMGTAVIGGTISSTLLTLVLLPVLLLLVKNRVSKAAVGSKRRNEMVDKALEISVSGSSVRR